MEAQMALVLFAVIAIIGQVLNVLLCLALDKIFSTTVGALAFVLLYMVVFAGAWVLTIRFLDRKERALITDQRMPEAARHSDPSWA
jgi:hypothetical protein